MRVISGFLKGKLLSFTKSNITRPFKDSVKENIFNIIIHSKFINIEIKKSTVLDLYCGIGSFGIECISRGANKIFFVDEDPKAFKILNENLKSLGIEKKTKAINDKIENYLETISSERFQIIFFDPPFKEIDYLNHLKLIKKKKIYRNNHLIIIHRDKKSKDDYNKILDPLIVKQYGRSKIIFGIFAS
mgnify:FL=1